MRENAVDDFAKWLQVTLGSIFSYTLKKDFDADYIGKYKDQKTFFYFSSGFAGQIKVYGFSTKMDTICAFCYVRAS